MHSMSFSKRHHIKRSSLQNQQIPQVFEIADGEEIRAALKLESWDEYQFFT